MDINRVCLTGRLTKDIDVSYCNDKKVGNFTLAINDGKDSNGNDRSYFIRCVIWGRPVEILEQYTHKGDKLGVDGKICSRSYDNKDGQKVYVTEVFVEKFTFLETKKTNNATNNTPSYDISEDDLPFY